MRDLMPPRDMERQAMRDLIAKHRLLAGGIAPRYTLSHRVTLLKEPWDIGRAAPSPVSKLVAAKQWAYDAMCGAGLVFGLGMVAYALIVLGEAIAR